MTETWIDWAIRAPVPPGYDGYSFDPDRRLDEILYIVNHSAEGWRSSLVLGHRPGETASWTFSVMVDGQLYQHMPLEKLAYTSGSYEANRDGIGREHEGVKGTPITPFQVATDQRLDRDLQRLCPNLRPLVLGQGYREHSELTNGFTSCPSGRIQPLYDAHPGTEDAMQIVKTPSGAQYILGPYGPVPITFDYAKALLAAGVSQSVTNVTDAQLNDLAQHAPKIPVGGSAGPHTHQATTIINNS